MLGAWFKSFRSHHRPVAVTPPLAVTVDRSTPAATLRTLAQAYIHGDAAALLACVDDRDSAWPKGRVAGWATFVEAAGRFRRAADAAFGPGSGDALVAEVLLRDPKEQGTALLELLDREGLPPLAGEGSHVAMPHSFVLGPTRLVQTADGWKITGGAAEPQAAAKIDPQLLLEAMDRSDRMMVADVETAYFLAESIESGQFTSIAQVRSAGERERTRAHKRSGWADRRFGRRLLDAARQAGW